MNRLTQFALVRHNLGRKAGRTGFLVFLVGLFSFTLYCGTVTADRIAGGTRVMAERLGADALFVPYGYSNKVQSSLLRGEPSSFYMDSALAGELRARKGVEKVTTQLFIATLNAACCTLPVQLIGIDPETDFVVKPWMIASLNRPLGEHEVVVGKKISGKVGENIQLFGREFTIAARLDATGMGFDTSVFMDMNRARTLLLLSELGPHLNLPEEMNRNTFVSSVLVKLSPSLNLRDTVNAILEEHAIKYNLDFVMVAGMISDIAAKLQIFSGFFHIFSATLWGMALIVLGLVFSSIIQERKKEFGLLRVIGASRSALAGIVAKEALLVSSLGAACGVFCGALLLALFRTYIEATLELPSISPGLPSLLGTAAGVFLLGALTGPLGCLPAIHTLGRTDAYLAMREEA